MIPKKLGDLCRHIVPPAGVGDPRPVLQKTQAAAVASIRTAAAWLNGMADHVDQAPWADSLFDDCDRLLNDLLTRAGQAMVTFRATRDCGGEG